MGMKARPPKVRERWIIGTSLLIARLADAGATSTTIAAVALEVGLTRDQATATIDRIIDLADDPKILITRKDDEVTWRSTESKAGYCCPVEPARATDIARAAFRADGVTVSYTVISEATDDSAEAICETCHEPISARERQIVELITDGLVATPRHCLRCADRLVTASE